MRPICNILNREERKHRSLREYQLRLFIFLVGDQGPFCLRPAPEWLREMTRGSRISNIPADGLPYCLYHCRLVVNVRMLRHQIAPQFCTPRYQRP